MVAHTRILKMEAAPNEHAKESEKARMIARQIDGEKMRNIEME